jgi:poly-gamma-glutamate synthesis protein (capsule biosynthesis protein)
MNAQAIKQRRINPAFQAPFTGRRRTWGFIPRRISLFSVVLFALLLAGCAAATATQPQPTTSTAAAPSATVAPGAPTARPPTATAAPTPSATPQPISLWVAPQVPEAVRLGVKLPDGWVWGLKEKTATYRLALQEGGAVGTLVYALAAPFPTITDTVTLEALQAYWRGAEPGGPFGAQPLLMDSATHALLWEAWGWPAEGTVQDVPASQLLDYAWAQRPAWAIVPFEALDPRWKVLRVDGLSPLEKTFDPAAYPLSFSFGLTDRDGAPVAELPAAWLAANPAPITNRDPSKLTVVVTTGVTALVRSTAAWMYMFGVNYPAEEIGGVLAGADITHISNEVPFDERCPYNPQDNDLRFCTHPRYLPLLETVGVDVIELTGDHFIDYGPEAVLYTLQLYQEHGWKYYGGGANLAEGLQPVTFEHNGNQIAFLGCNAKGGGYATASAANPGAAACGYETLQAEIKALKAQGYVVITTFQHEEYYSYTVLPQFRPDFIGMAEAGADIVQGSQAHQPQNFEYANQAFIHYGLGNLFFDQFGFTAAAEDAFIDRHIIYNGQHISTELLTIHFVDYAKPRWMTPEERAVLLAVVFKASGW